MERNGAYGDKYQATNALNTYDPPTRTELTTDLAVPTADTTANVDVIDVAGNKTDAAVTTVGTTKSLMGYIKGILGRTCGNGVVEIGEGCDDGGVLWNSGACAGDCSRINYWSNPKIGSNYLDADIMTLDRWCGEHGYNDRTSSGSTAFTGEFANYTLTSDPATSGWRLTAASDATIVSYIYCVN